VVEREHEAVRAVRGADERDAEQRRALGREPGAAIVVEQRREPSALLGGGLRAPVVRDHRHAHARQHDLQRLGPAAPHERGAQDRVARDHGLPRVDEPRDVELARQHEHRLLDVDPRPGRGQGLAQHTEL